MNYQIAVIPGDGIGPEIVTEAMKVLDRVGAVYGHTFTYKKLLMGGASIDVTWRYTPARGLGGGAAATSAAGSPRRGLPWLPPW